jgi:hypothetical protein
MALKKINDKLPDEVKTKILGDEIAYHFEYIPFEKKAGCGEGDKKTSGNDFIMISDKRILYEATVITEEDNTEKMTQDSGTIPVGKVSFVKTRKSETEDGGCFGENTAYYALDVNSGGGEINIAIPTKEAADRAKSVIEEIIL